MNSLRVMGWSTVALSEVTNIISGGTPKSGVTEFWEGDVEWITPKDMGKMSGIYASDTSRKITKVGLSKSSAKLIAQNSVILSTRAPIGHLAINTVPMATNQGCRGLTPKDNLDTKYLFYFLFNSVGLLNDLGSGTTFKELSKGALEKVCIPLPPIPEQKRIVALLDTVFADLEQTRAKTEQNLKNARELFDSYLQQVFSQKGKGWVELPLGDICNFKHGFAFKSEFFVDKSELILLTPGNFYEDGGYKDRGEKQKHYKGDFPEEFLLAKGSLLVAMTEQAAGLLGSSALVPKGNMFLHNQRLGLVEITPDFEGKVSLNFLFHLFNTKYFRVKVQETATGLKVRHTSPKKMQVILIPLLKEFTEQEAIAQKLFEVKENVIELEVIYQKKLNSIAELKKAILQKAFSGELTK